MVSLKTPSVPALERALAILDVLALSGGGLSLSALTRKLGLPKSSTHCLLLTLERSGYLYRDPSARRYVIGSKIFTLANVAINGLPLRQRTRPHLRRLMDRTRLTVHMAVLDRNEAVLVEKIDPPGPARLATWLGKRMDVHCTGVGKALLAYLPEEQVDSLAREHGLPRHNENTIVSTRRLKENLAHIRRLGYSLDDEEDEIGFRCVGCPVLDEKGDLLAAVSVSGTVSQITAENLLALAGEVKTAADAVRQASWAQEVRLSR